MKTNITLAIISILLISFVMAPVSFAQINVKGYVKEKTREKANEAVKEGFGNIFNADENDDGNTSEEVNDTESVPVGEIEDVPSDAENVDNEDKSMPDDKPKMESYTQYDFVPGDKILFFEDFSQDAIGDFPALWTSNSSGEVKTTNIAPGKWLHMNGEDATYCYSKEIEFPDNFIIEFDIIPDAEYYDGITLTLYQVDKNDVREVEDGLYPGLQGLHLKIGPERWNTIGYGVDAEGNSRDWLEGSATKNPVVKETVNHVIIWIQKRRVRIYHMGTKVLDVPTNIYPEARFDRFRFIAWDSHSYPYISNVKITTAAPDMRSKLLTEGKLISYGIYFDSGKDQVKPESYGSLMGIANVLTENPDVTIMIVGHTDNDGEDAMNLDLSKRRAASVKTYLVTKFNIAADRIQTDGKGESQSLVPNTGAENKAKNRRVEFIKL
ncbi:MAG: OmpA family protein [Bacteroidales bacterium]|nr:OmpA family protein [Bacteroidales bacterium]HQP04814.1 OmpA family protein [Bacteroidales bacterium]